MSGIAGIIGNGAKIDKLGSMLEAICHRGPGRCKRTALVQGVVGSVEMGFFPPEPDGEKNSAPVVLLDGSLYNDGSESDTSLVRGLYRRLGKKSFSNLDGSFACAIVDKDETILARDAVGARPVMYGTGPDKTFYFASEAKALREHLDEVHELMPGHIFSTVEGLQPFSPFASQVPDFDSPEEAARVLRELIIRAVEKAVSTGPIMGVSLSGGLDSSIILAVAREFNPDLKAFSATIKEHPGEDLEYARLMADRSGIKLYTYALDNEDIVLAIPKAVWHLESFDEDCVSGFIANYYTSRLASEYTDCVLVGEGADELFGGYFREFRDIAETDEKERVARKLVDIAYNTALRRLDRAWTANSVDYRAPFLDPAVVAFSEKIPLDLKVYIGERPVEKWILREAFRDMLPGEIADRPKLRFARGVGVDSLMDQAIAGKVSSGDFEACRKTEQGLMLGSPKELYFYRLFRKYFPKGYEKLTVRWDPFK